MDITFLQCMLGLILLAVPCYAMYIFKVQLLNKVLIAGVKMVVSLLLLGVSLHYVIQWNHPAVTFLFGMVMILVGSVLTIQRARLQLRQMLIPVLAGMSVGVLVVGAYFLLFVMGQKNPLEARFLIPILGLLVGHIILANSQALHIYYMGLCHHAQLYHYLLGNGAKHDEALGYLMRRAVERAALPSVSNMGLTVVMASPVILWGMLLAGASVLAAVAFQILLLIAMFSASIVSVVVTLVISRKYLLDDYSQLKGDGRHDTEA